MLQCSLAAIDSSVDTGLNSRENYLNIEGSHKFWNQENNMKYVGNSDYFKVYLK